MTFLIWFRGIFELSKWFLAALLLVFLLHSFVMTIFIVSGSSMEPNISEGQVVVVDRLTYQWRPPRRGEMVVVRYPGDPDGAYYVKRVIGLAGERLEFKDGSVFVNGQRLVERYLSALTLPDQSVLVPEDAYFTMGDNREFSSDSRIWGAAERRFILGRVLISVWPLVQAHGIPLYL